MEPVPMPEHIRQLDEQVRQTHAYMETEENVNKLQEGQDNILKEMKLHEEENERQFNHGAEIMGELKEQGLDHSKQLVTLNNRMDEMQKEFKDTLERGFSEIRNDIKDEKNKESITRQKEENEKLKGDIKEMIAEKRKTDNRIWDIAKIFAAILIAAALGYLGIK